MMTNKGTPEERAVPRIQKWLEKADGGVESNPWAVRKRGSKWCVVRADTGKLMHAYPGNAAGRRRAIKYLRALEMHAHD